MAQQNSDKCSGLLRGTDLLMAELEQPSSFLVIKCWVDVGYPTSTYTACEIIIGHTYSGLHVSVI